MGARGSLLRASPRREASREADVAVREIGRSFLVVDRAGKLKRVLARIRAPGLAALASLST